MNWWPKKETNYDDKTTKANNKSADIKNLKFAPLATIGIRYITHTKSFAILSREPIHYRKLKSSRVDCSITSSSRYLSENKKYYLIYRLCTLLSTALNNHNALTVSLELGHNRYTRALLANILPGAGLEVATLLGYEMRYGICLLQLQLAYEITDSQRLDTNPNENKLSSSLNKRLSVCMNMQYMITDYVFLAITARSQEIPGLRLGVFL